MLLLLMLICCR